jgi:hypothetical protein
MKETIMNTPVMSQQEKTFQTTIEILRRQRETQSDLVVQLSVQITELAAHSAAQQQSIIDLQQEKDELLVEQSCMLNNTRHVIAKLDQLDKQLKLILSSVNMLV